MSKVYPVSNYREYRPSRNPYRQKILEFAPLDGRATVLADEFTEQHRGRWRAYFGLPENALLNVELGAYHGETSIHLAGNAPEGAHIGIEWKYKQCFKAGKKARDTGVRNLAFLRANNARLPWMFAPGEVDRIWVLFPDPWSKLSQQKWRLLQPSFFRLLGSMLKEGKELMLKTDHGEYAEFIGESLREAGCFDPLTPAEAKARWALIPPTPFERIFLRQGLPIYPFALVRNAKEVIPPEEVKNVLSLH